MSARMICDACGTPTNYINGELPLGWRKVNVEFLNDHGTEVVYSADICRECLGSDCAVAHDKMLLGLRGNR